MKTQDAIELATQYLADLSGHTFDLLTISRLFTSRQNEALKSAFQQHLDIKTENVDELLD